MNPAEINDEPGIAIQQIDAHNRLMHLLDIKGLNATVLHALLDKATTFIDKRGQLQRCALLRNKSMVNLFFEPSTRTRTSFECAAKRLGADVINFDAQRSSTLKGETLLDTMKTLEAMQCDAFILRHNQAYAAHFLAAHAGTQTAIINAGDGMHAHPTQALLDIFTIQQQKIAFDRIKVAIIGDIRHSRVAKSLIQALSHLSTARISLAGPNSLLPNTLPENPAIEICTDIETALTDADVVVMLRLQKERMAATDMPEPEAYFADYGLTRLRLRLAKPDAIVMHPGPINRDIEIAAEVADGPQSRILQQVTHGVAVRMAVMTALLEHR